MMKVLLLAPANSVHTHRWVEGLHSRGVEVVLVSQHDPESWQPPEGVRSHRLRIAGRLGYFLNVPAMRRLIARERPDLLNAHYASGYGTTAALAGFAPTLLSVWGSDVYDFPFEARWKGRLLRRNLARASRIASTSEVMARQTNSLLDLRKPVLITPFGVDGELFHPRPRRDPDLLTIGTVKTLAHKYGIDMLIAAFAALLSESDRAMASLRPRLRLVIVGGGDERPRLEAQAAQLGVADRVRFIGPVPHAQVPDWLNTFDIYVAASRLDSESFGVAAVEAGACGIPVIVSDVGGLPEVVVDGLTGCVVPRENSTALAAAIRRLALNPELRLAMGRAGRLHAMQNYSWDRCVERMLDAYRQTLDEGRSCESCT